MSYEEIVDFVKKLGIGRKKLGKYLEDHFRDVYDEIIEKTKFLDRTNIKNIEISFSERMYCIENGIYNRPQCIECGKYVEFRKDERHYRDFCSVKCSKSSVRTKEKREKTCLEKYGDPHFTNKDGARNTRYGKNNGKWHSDDFGAVVKRVKLERHGDESWSNEEARRKTCLDKYGVEHPLKLACIQKKCRDSFLKRHPGMNSTMDIPSVREKLHRGSRLRSWEFIKSNTLVEPLFTREEYVSCDNPTTTEFRFKCKKCGNEFLSTWDNGSSSLCKICHPGLNGTSEAEKDLFDFVKLNLKPGWKAHNSETINRSIIPPKEIDIVVCDENDNVRLLIEYDGLYFPSCDAFNANKRTYHLSKTEECEKMGYKLIHVFENEWMSNREIVKSRIRDNIGSYENTVYARKCEVRSVGNDLKDVFLIRNHIQGTCTSSVNVGLFFNGELISIATFGRPRFSRENEWELLRFCNRLGYHVPGAASRLLKHFEKNVNPSSLISYADRRWSNGNLYSKLGFKFTHASKPNYWYFKPNNPTRIFNRMRFQKYRLKSLLDKYDEKMTEVENMRNNGYLRIFDCGNLVYVKKTE